MKDTSETQVPGYATPQITIGRIENHLNFQAAGLVRVRCGGSTVLQKIEPCSSIPSQTR
jgi:hypothetical protein